METWYTPSGGWISQAAASTQLFFAALQRRHLLRLNLHPIQSFYLHPLFKKDPEDPPQDPAPPTVTKLEFPECPPRRPHLNQTNASFDALEPQPLPTTRHCPFQTHASLRALSLRGLCSPAQDCQ